MPLRRVCVTRVNQATLKVGGAILADEDAINQTALNGKPNAEIEK